MQAFLYLNCLCVIYFQIYIFFLSPVFYVLDSENDKGNLQADIGSLSVQFCVYIKSYLCFCVWDGNVFWVCLCFLLIQIEFVGSVSFERRHDGLCLCVSSESRLHVCGQRGRQIFMSPPACVGLFGPVVTFSLQAVLPSDVNLSTRVHIIWAIVEYYPITRKILDNSVFVARTQFHRTYEFTSLVPTKTALWIPWIPGLLSRSIDSNRRRL